MQNQVGRRHLLARGGILHAIALHLFLGGRVFVVAQIEQVLLPHLKIIYDLGVVLLTITTGQVCVLELLILISTRGGQLILLLHRHIIVGISIMLLIERDHTSFRRGAIAPPETEYRVVFKLLDVFKHDLMKLAIHVVLGSRAFASDAKRSVELDLTAAPTRMANQVIDKPVLLVIVRGVLFTDGVDVIVR